MIHVMIVRNAQHTLDCSTVSVGGGIYQKFEQYQTWRLTRVQGRRDKETSVLGHSIKASAKSFQVHADLFRRLSERTARTIAKRLQNAPIILRKRSAHFRHVSFIKPRRRVVTNQFAQSAKLRIKIWH